MMINTVFIVWLCFLFIIPLKSYAGETIVDMAGRHVALPQEVSRVVAISGALRLITYLDGLDKIVGVEGIERRMSQDAMRPYSMVVKERLNDIPTIGEGGGGRIPDFERLVAVKPQLIITSDPNISNAELIQSKTGIPVLVITYGNIGVLELDKFYASLRLLGKVFKKEKRAEEVVSFINKAVVDINKRTSNIQTKKKVYIGGLGYRGAHGITSTQGHYPPFQWVNALNVAYDESRQGPYFIEKEQLIRWNPDFIFIDNGGLGIVKADKKEQVLKSELKAVRDKKVFITLPYNNYYTNIEYALSNSYFIGKTVYPDRFYEIDIYKKTDEIVRFMLGKSLSDFIKKDTMAFKPYDLK